MKYRTNRLKSILRKSFKSRKEFEDEITSHKRGIMLSLKQHVTPSNQCGQKINLTFK